jgi:hypothetical protein
MLSSNDPAGASGPLNPGEQPQAPASPPEPLQSGEQSPALPPWPAASGPLPPPPPVPIPGMSGALADEPTLVGSQPWLSAPASGPLPQAPGAPAWPSASGPIFAPSGPLAWQPALASPAPDAGSRAATRSGWLLAAAIFGVALAVLGGVLFVITPASSASVHADALSTYGGLAALIAGLVLIALPFALGFWRGRSGKGQQQAGAASAPVGVAVGAGVPASQPPEAEAGG